MRIFLGLFFLASSALLLSKNLTIGYMNWWLNQKDKTLSILGLCFIPISILFILWSSNVPEWEESLGRIIVFVIGIVTLIEALTILFFPSAIKKLIRFYISLNFYFWAFPQVLVCLLIGFLLLIGS